MYQDFVFLPDFFKYLLMSYCYRLIFNLFLQIETLKEEIERRQNDHQVKSAHNLILELQTELAEYKDLTDSLQLAEKLQVCIFEGSFETQKK